MIRIVIFSFITALTTGIIYDLVDELLFHLRYADEEFVNYCSMYLPITGIRIDVAGLLAFVILTILVLYIKYMLYTARKIVEK